MENLDFFIENQELVKKWNEMKQNRYNLISASVIQIFFAFLIVAGFYYMHSIAQGANTAKNQTLAGIIILVIVFLGIRIIPDFIDYRKSIRSYQNEDLNKREKIEKLCEKYTVSYPHEDKDSIAIKALNYHLKKWNGFFYKKYFILININTQFILILNPDEISIFDDIKRAPVLDEEVFKVTLKLNQLQTLTLIRRKDMDKLTAWLEKYKKHS
ncbi:MAG: hypothetical protein ACLFQV_00185 [Vulcanimicrobiota bacterium]